MSPTTRDSHPDQAPPAEAQASAPVRWSLTLPVVLTLARRSLRFVADLAQKAHDKAEEALKKLEPLDPPPPGTGPTDSGMVP